MCAHSDGICRTCRLTWKLKRDYGNEWWNHPDLIPPPGEIEYSSETAFELLIQETRLYITAKDNGMPTMALLRREAVENAAQDLARAMEKRDGADNSDG